MEERDVPLTPAEQGHVAEFLDGWSLVEAHVTVHVAPTGLRIVNVGGQTLRTWDAPGLHCDAMQEGGVLHVTHASVPHETLVVRDAQLGHRILTISTKVQALPGGERKLSYGLTVLAVLAALLGLTYYFTPQLAQFVAHRVPLEEERILGRELEAVLDFSRCDDPDATAALTRLAARLGDGQAYEVRLTKMDAPNAFALPGGMILVSTGLVQEAESGDEIAGVMAHELEHVAQRHVLAGFIRDTVLSGLWALTLGDYAGLLVVDPTTAYRVATPR